MAGDSHSGGLGGNRARSAFVIGGSYASNTLPCMMREVGGFSRERKEDKEGQFGKQALSIGQEGRKQGMKGRGGVDKLGPAVRGCFQTVLKDFREPLRVWRPVACKRKHALPMVYERVKKQLILYDDNE